MGLVSVTFGIDISQVQKGIDLKAAKAQGVQFVIAKAGGYNIKPMYVGSAYKQQIDDAKKVGLPVGHYWLVGKGDPAAQARFFVANLHNFNKNTDVLALDNERLDSNATFFSDAQVYLFFTTVIQLTGIDPKRLWLYAGSYDYRIHAPWTKTFSLGVVPWVAAYGILPGTTGRTPTVLSVPNSLKGIVPGVAEGKYVHQFSSNVTIAGRRVDANYTKMTVSELFGSTQPVAAPVADGDWMVIQSLLPGDIIHEGDVHYFGMDKFNMARLMIVNGALVRSVWDPNAVRWVDTWKSNVGSAKWKNVRFVMQNDGNFVGYRTGPIRPQIVVWFDDLLRRSKVKDSHLTLDGTNYSLTVYAPDGEIMWRVN